MLAAPSIIAVLLVPYPSASFGLMVVAYVTAETWLGPAAAIVQVCDGNCCCGVMVTLVIVAIAMVTIVIVTLVMVTIIMVTMAMVTVVIVTIVMVSVTAVTVAIAIVIYNGDYFWLQDICMPAMRAQASAVYIGVITIFASLGPVLVSRKAYKLFHSTISISPLSPGTSSDG